MQNKFKGKQTQNGEWVVGALVEFSEEHKCIIPMESTIETENGCFVSSIQLVEIDPKTASWSTGLCDKEGREIHVNDIILDCLFDGYWFYYCNCRVCFGMFSEKDEEGRMGHYYGLYIEGFNQKGQTIQTHFYPDKDTKIIGNIFDNQELMSKPSVTLVR
jgi:uncharacterized phage protein (TIGR01671 family)